MIWSEDKQIADALTGETDQNILDALIAFYEEIKQAKERGATGQIIAHIKDGSVGTIVGVPSAHDLRKRKSA